MSRYTYQAQVSSRQSYGHRGVRMGMGPHYEREGWVRFLLNMDAEDQTLTLRHGHVKRYIVDSGYINTVHVENDLRVVSVNGEIHMATIEPVPAPYYSKSESDDKFVPYGDFNTAGNIQVITDPPSGFTAGLYIEDANNVGTWHRVIATSQYGAISLAIESTGTTLP